MQYLSDKDYEYIQNKYNASRWERQDFLFDENTGMDGQEIKKELKLQEENSENLHPYIRTANAFAFVLKHTRIACSPRDKFPAINAVDRPVFTALSVMREKKVRDLLGEKAKKIDALYDSGTMTFWPDYSHSVPVWDRIFSLGFAGILKESELARVSAPQGKDETAFFDGIKITYQAIIDFIGRLQKQAEKDGSPRMATALSHIQYNPPKTFYQALLVDYLYFMLCEHITGMQVRSLSNFDKLFYPFYQNDLENGVSEEELRTDLAYFFMQFTSINNYYNQPVYLGGCKENEETVINPFSYVFLDVYDKLNIFNPKIQIKVAKNTPKAFLLKALDMVRRGNNSIVFVCDETMRKALIKAGASEKQARECDVKGCYEYTVQGGIGSEMNYINLIKPLEYLFHDGHDALTGEAFGLPAPALSSYSTFDEFFQEYKRQLSHLIDQTVELVNEYDNYLAYIQSQPMLSATIPACLKTGKDALAGGSDFYHAIIPCGFLASITDSLAMIKKHVFDKKTLDLEQFKEILNKDYEGHEKFRLKLLNDPDKFGNNQDFPDSIAKDIVQFLVSYIQAKTTNPLRGGRWDIAFHVARQSYDQGKKTAATPNGRKKGEELSKNISASMGQNKQGATAAILSATKIDASQFASDAALDLGLLPSAVKGEDGLEVMYGLLRTFMARGGHALQINVFNADTLRDAQAHPEKYQDLQIRVCGWNVLWNNIKKEEQEGFIKQAESLI